MEKGVLFEMSCFFSMTDVSLLLHTHTQPFYNRQLLNALIVAPVVLQPIFDSFGGSGKSETG